MKVIVIPNNLNIKDCDGFLLGLKDYSIGFSYQVTVDELKKIIKEYPQKEIFLSINRNLFSKDIEKLKSLLIEISNLKITGLLFNDLGIINIVKELNLKIKLVWNQNFLVVNSKTSDFYFDLRIKMGVLANELTYEEIKYLVDNSKMKFMVQLFGYRLEAVSKRKFLKSFYEYNNKDYHSRLLISDKNEQKTSIIKEDTDTLIYDNSLYNGSTLLNLNIDYGIINENDFEEKTFNELLKLTNNFLKTKNNEYLLAINKLISNNNGFLNTKTIYKVK